MFRGVFRFVQIISRFLNNFFQILLMRIVSTFRRFQACDRSFVVPLCVFRATPFSERYQEIMYLALRLISMPIHLRMARIACTCVNARAFHFLIMPRKRDVIIAVNGSGQIAFFLCNTRMILSRITYRVAITTIIIIPHLTRRLSKCRRAGCDYGSKDQFLARFTLRPLNGAHRARTCPSNGYVRQAYMYVIAFTKLRQNLIRVGRSNRANRRRRRRCSPRLLSACQFFCLFPVQDHSAFYLMDLPRRASGSRGRQRTVRCVIPFIIFRIKKRRTLITRRRLIRGQCSNGPITVFCFALSLCIVLTSNGIPRRVSPMRMIRLMSGRRLSIVPLNQSFRRRRLSTLIMEGLRTFSTTRPIFMNLYIYVTMRTQRRRVLYVLMVNLVARCFMTILFVKDHFLLPLVRKDTFHRVVCASSIRFFRYQFKNMYLSMRREANSVLLTTRMFSWDRSIFQEILIRQDVNNETSRGRNM